MKPCPICCVETDCEHRSSNRASLQDVLLYEAGVEEGRRQMRQDIMTAVSQLWVDPIITVVKKYDIDNAIMSTPIGGEK